MTRVGQIQKLIQHAESLHFLYLESLCHAVHAVNNNNDNNNDNNNNSNNKAQIVPPLK
jgi:hypothetical protein